MTPPQATGVSPRIVSSFPAPAVAPAEWRGIGRDEVRLLVSDDAGDYLRHEFGDVHLLWKQ